MIDDPILRRIAVEYAWGVKLRIAPKQTSTRPTRNMFLEWERLRRNLREAK